MERQFRFTRQLENSGFDCKSHYWIQNSNVRWARRWTQAEIASGRAQDGLTKKQYFMGDPDLNELNRPADAQSPATTEQPRGLWRWMIGWTFGRKR